MNVHTVCMLRVKRASMKANRKIELGEATRLALVAAARDLFASGYDAAGTPAIALKAGVTRGALYHHFKDKRDLFKAVVEQVAEDIVVQIDAAATRSQVPTDSIIAGCKAFVSACDNAAIRQIFFLDAPAVLGWKAWRAIDACYGLGSLMQGLSACAAAGLLEVEQVGSAAHLISGALNEAVFMLAEQPNQSHVRDRIDRSIERMVRGLLQTP